MWFQVFTSTPIGRAVSTASSEAQERVGRLVDSSYMLAKEELPFTKYPKIAALEMRHGVNLGNTYLTEIKCQEFTFLIGQHLQQELRNSLASAQYFSVLLDGASDCSTEEKEAIFVTIVDTAGDITTKFLRLKNLLHGNAEGIKQGLQESFVDIEISSLDR